MLWDFFSLSCSCNIQFYFFMWNTFSESILKRAPERDFIHFKFQAYILCRMWICVDQKTEEKEVKQRFQIAICKNVYELSYHKTYTQKFLWMGGRWWQSYDCDMPVGVCEEGWKRMEKLCGKKLYIYFAHRPAQSGKKCWRLLKWNQKKRETSSSE